MLNSKTDVVTKLGLVGLGIALLGNTNKGNFSNLRHPDSWPKKTRLDKLSLSSKSEDLNAPAFIPAFCLALECIGNRYHQNQALRREEPQAERRSYFAVEDPLSTFLLSTREVRDGETTGTQRNASINPVIQEKLLKGVQNYRQEAKLPALYAFICSRGKVIGLVADGLKNLETSEKATQEDILRIGSNSKMVSTTLLAVLEEKGLFQWNDTIGETFPELAKKYPGHPLLKATALQLVCHRGGFASQPDMYGKFKDLSSPEWRFKYIEECLKMPAAALPGEKEIYGPGVSWVIAMAERHTKKTFDQLFDEYLGKPLGITSFCMGSGKLTGSAATPAGYVRDPKPDGYKRSGSDWNEYLKNDPSGGICMSMMDLAKIYSLRAGTSSLHLSPKNLRILNSGVYAGTAPGGYIGSFEGHNWVGHSGDTGCGDWSRVDICPDQQLVIFFHTNWESQKGSAHEEYGDFLKSFKSFALHLPEL